MRHLTKQLLIPITIAFLILSSINAKAQPVKGTFLYNLSDFTGTIPYSWSRVIVDKNRNETYVLYENNIKVFNEFGMEIYRFGEDLDIGQIADVAVDKNGDILLLAYKKSDGLSKGEIVHCNYRGEPKSNIEFKNLPSEYSDFSPNRMVYQAGNIYLVSLTGMKIVIADEKGNFKKGYDLFPLLELEEKDRGNVEMDGFSVDKEGNILMTSAVLFRACILSPDGKINWFGKPGSGPGRFNILAGIVRDSRGNYLVVDKLKCAVMVFGRDFKFLSQFGNRGTKLGNLISPDDIAIDNGDRIYVTQTANRGISVFRMIYN